MFTGNDDRTHKKDVEQWMLTELQLQSEVTELYMQLVLNVGISSTPD